MTRARNDFRHRYAVSHSPINRTETKLSSSIARRSFARLISSGHQMQIASVSQVGPSRFFRAANDCGSDSKDTTARTLTTFCISLHAANATSHTSRVFLYCPIHVSRIPNAMWKKDPTRPDGSSAYRANAQISILFSNLSHGPYENHNTSAS